MNTRTRCLLALLTLTTLTACGAEVGPGAENDAEPFDLDERFDAASDEDADAGAVSVDAGEDVGKDVSQDVGTEDVGGLDAGHAEDVGGEDAGEVDAGDPNALDAPLGGARPARVTLPAGYDNSREVPLVIGLHGFGGTDESIGRYFSLERNVDDRDFIFVSPQGTRNSVGRNYWNATPACCDGFNSGVDDAGYLRGIIEEAIGRFNIDRGRIYVAGYSNGGFMSYRLACDSADYVTGIFVLAGGTFKDETLCQPAQPVQILHLHGTADETIAYDGGKAFFTLPEHPGAVESVTTWATYNGCDPTPVQLDAAAVDAVTVETPTVTGFGGCPDDGQVELWTLPDAPHNPGLPQTMGTHVLDRLFAIDRTP